MPFGNLLSMKGSEKERRNRAKGYTWKLERLRLRKDAIAG